jgi:hypothetical protein
MNYADEKYGISIRGRFRICKKVKIHNLAVDFKVRSID